MLQFFYCSIYFILFYICGWLYCYWYYYHFYQSFYSWVCCVGPMALAQCCGRSGTSSLRSRIACDSSWSTRLLTSGNILIHRNDHHFVFSVVKSVTVWHAFLCGQNLTWYRWVLNLALFGRNSRFKFIYCHSSGITW